LLPGQRLVQSGLDGLVDDLADDVTNGGLDAAGQGGIEATEDAIEADDLSGPADSGGKGLTQPQGQLLQAVVELPQALQQAAGPVLVAARSAPGFLLVAGGGDGSRGYGDGGRRWRREEAASAARLCRLCCFRAASSLAVRASASCSCLCTASASARGSRAASAGVSRRLGGCLSLCSDMRILFLLGTDAGRAAERSRASHT
jgi:hypothetical protein